VGGSDVERVAELLADPLDGVVDGLQVAARLPGDVLAGDALQSQDQHLGLERAEGPLGRSAISRSAAMSKGSGARGSGRGPRGRLPVLGPGLVREEREGVVEGLVLTAPGHDEAGHEPAPDAQWAKAEKGVPSPGLQRRVALRRLVRLRSASSRAGRSFYLRENTTAGHTTR
jgi:hypothetical protein